MTTEIMGKGVELSMGSNLQQTELLVVEAASMIDLRFILEGVPCLAISISVNSIRKRIFMTKHMKLEIY